MNIVIAPDSFKGSLSSIKAGEAIKRGLARALPHAQFTVVPMADGGEGTMDALLYRLEGEKVEITTRDSLERSQLCTIALANKKTLAIIESASIVGLPSLSPEERNPLQTTTYGLGEAILYCLNQGIRQFIIGLGGSATNDGGIGLLEALGAQFFQDDKPVHHVRAGDLTSINKVDLSGLDARIEECQFMIASDVDNPLCGERGASAVFGPQKGATPEMVTVLDQGLYHYAKLLDAKEQFLNQPGAGAAGGLGFIFLFLGGKLQPGAEIVSNYLSLDSKLQKANLLITGEGKTDVQSLYGKAPYYLAQQAKKYGANVIILSGSLGERYQDLSSFVDCFFSIIPHPVSLEEAIAHGEQWLEEAAYNIGRLLAIT